MRFKEGKRFLILVCLTFSCVFMACSNNETQKYSGDINEDTSANGIKNTIDDIHYNTFDNVIENTKVTEAVSDLDESKDSSKDDEMNLYINGRIVPVIWEDNETVDEMITELSNGDIVVSMSMYSDFEQVGFLGRSYTRNDKQITTHNGEIVLYNGSNIVIFYGTNSWLYTRLGKIDLPEDKVTDLLANGNVTLKITKQEGDKNG